MPLIVAQHGPPEQPFHHGAPSVFMTAATSNIAGGPAAAPAHTQEAYDPVQQDQSPVQEVEAEVDPILAPYISSELKPRPLPQSSSKPQARTVKQQQAHSIFFLFYFV